MVNDQRPPSRAGFGLTFITGALLWVLVGLLAWLVYKGW